MPAACQKHTVPQPRRAPPCHILCRLAAAAAVGGGRLHGVLLGVRGPVVAGAAPLPPPAARPARDVCDCSLSECSGQTPLRETEREMVAAAARRTSEQISSIDALDDKRSLQLRKPLELPVFPQLFKPHFFKDNIATVNGLIRPEASQGCKLQGGKHHGTGGGGRTRRPGWLQPRTCCPLPIPPSPMPSQLYPGSYRPSTHNTKRWSICRAVLRPRETSTGAIRPINRAATSLFDFASPPAARTMASFAEAPAGDVAKGELQGRRSGFRAAYLASGASIGAAGAAVWLRVLAAGPVGGAVLLFPAPRLAAMPWACFDGCRSRLDSFRAAAPASSALLLEWTSNPCCLAAALPLGPPSASP